MNGAGVKELTGKSRVDLVPPEAIFDAARAFEAGLVKYPENGWRTVPGARSKYLASTMRHLLRHSMGERTDEESGLPHLTHALADLMIVVASPEEAPTIQRRFESARVTARGTLETAVEWTAELAAEALVRGVAVWAWWRTR